MNTAYKHLDSKLRIGDLTVVQWISVILGIGIAVVWGMYVSPFGTYVTLVMSIYIGALPAAAALVASMSELDVWLMARSAIRWRRLDGRFASGPGRSARGYVVGEEADEPATARRPERARELDLSALWEGS